MTKEICNPGYCFVMYGKLAKVYLGTSSEIRTNIQEKFHCGGRVPRMVITTYAYRNSERELVENHDGDATVTLRWILGEHAVSSGGRQEVEEVQGHVRGALYLPFYKIISRLAILNVKTFKLS